MNIQEYKRSLPDIITHEALTSQLELAEKQLDMIEEMIPKYSAMWFKAGSILMSKVSKQKEVLTCNLIQNGLEIKNKGVHFGHTVRNILPNIVSNFKALKAKVASQFPDTVVTSNITANHLGIALHVSAIVYLVYFMTDLLSNSVVAWLRTQAKRKNAAYEQSGSVNRLHKYKDEFIKTVNLFAAPPAKFISDMGKALSTVITKANAAIIFSNLSSSVKNVLTYKSKNSFNGSPILSIRRAMIGWLTASYNQLEDERRYLELSLAQLENEARGNPSPGISNEMEMIEDRITTVKYKKKMILEETTGGHSHA